MIEHLLQHCIGLIQSCCVLCGVFQGVDIWVQLRYTAHECRVCPRGQTFLIMRMHGTFMRVHLHTVIAGVRLTANEEG